MEYRNLGKSGLQVSVVGLGTNNFGGRLDLDGVKGVVNQAVELGVTFFDTADVYGRGKSEELLGEALKPHRRNVLIATKTSQAMGDGPYWRGNSRRYLMDAVDACLRRLQTDYVDMLQMHRFDPLTPPEETQRALDDLVRSGKVRYIGSSTYTAWQTLEADWVSKTEHLERFISAQNQYNLLSRDIEADLVPVCERYGIGIIPYTPLASGFLTGKYRPNEAPPEGTRLAGPMGGRTLTEKNFDSLMKLEGFAQERGHSMIELAMGWLASRPFIGSIIASASSPEQVVENVGAVDWRLTPDEMTEIDAIMGVNQPAAGMARPAAAPAPAASRS